MAFGVCLLAQILTQLTLEISKYMCQDQLIFSCLMKHLSHKMRVNSKCTFHLMLMSTTVSSTPESGHDARVWIRPLMSFDKSMLQFNEYVIMCFYLSAGLF